MNPGLSALIALILVAPDVSKVPSPDDDRATLQGVWQASSWILDGKNASEETVKNYKVKVKENQFSSEIRQDLPDGTPRLSVSSFTFTLDPNQSPKAIDFVSDFGGKKQVVQGIYRIKGDTLELCTSKPGQDRPKEFTSKPGVGTSLTVCKKQKP